MSLKVFRGGRGGKSFLIPPSALKPSSIIHDAFKLDPSEHVKLFMNTNPATQLLPKQKQIESSLDSRSVVLNYLFNV